MKILLGLVLIAFIGVMGVGCGDEEAAEEETVTEEVAE